MSPDLDIVSVLSHLDTSTVPSGTLDKFKFDTDSSTNASSTGIIRMSTLMELFPQYDPQMLVELMVRLEFCHPVNLSGITTNLQPLSASSTDSSTEKFLFFPSLLHAERPQIFAGDVHSRQVGFGWCLGCMDYEYQFLTSRFLHVLLLRLAYTFPLPSKGYSKGHNLYGLEQRCTVWTNGISWNNNNGITTLVEVIQQNRWVVSNHVPQQGHHQTSGATACSRDGKKRNFSVELSVEEALNGWRLVVIPDKLTGWQNSSLTMSSTNICGSY